MQSVRRWAVLFVITLMMAGQVTYACDMMDIPAQPVCCCDEVTSRTDIADSSDEDCDAGHSKESCCTAKYSSPAKGAIAASLLPDKSPTPISALTPGPAPSLEALLSFPVFGQSEHANGSLLLDQATTGRTVYLSTRRLRI